MRTDLNLVLALAAKANAFLRGATGRMEVLAGHPVFARFHDLAFVRQTGLGGEIIAEGSVPWFRRLRNEGVARVRPALAGVRLEKGAESTWGLLTEGDRGLEVWSPNVGRRFQGHDDRQPLRLTMTSGRFDRWSLKPALAVEEASQVVFEALTATKAHLDDGHQSVAASAVGKFLSLHQTECPDVSGDLASLLPDLQPCSRAIFASGTRVLTLLETTGWANAADESAHALVEPLWAAAKVALETAV